jgi:hypothetical protein
LWPRDVARLYAPARIDTLLAAPYIAAKDTTMTLAYRLLAPALAMATAIMPATAAAENYLGLLKLPRAVQAEPPLVLGAYSFSSAPETSLFSAPTALVDNAYQLKLGYKYSRYFSVEGQFNDFARAPDPFSSPGSMASPFRGAGFGVDTIASIPLWRFSFYGRFGAYHGDARTPFSAYSTALTDPHGTRLRYGLGMRYDFTQAFGIVAEMERYSPVGSPLGSDGEADLFSVGLRWRF